MKPGRALIILIVVLLISVTVIGRVRASGDEPDPYRLALEPERVHKRPGDTIFFRATLGWEDGASPDDDERGRTVDVWAEPQEDLIYPNASRWRVYLAPHANRSVDLRVRPNATGEFTVAVWAEDEGDGFKFREKATATLSTLDRESTPMWPLAGVAALAAGACIWGRRQGCR